MRVIGTAGHVDHGKSTLVQALTGTHPDRLKEEQEREMTIDLGFAWMTLPDGAEIGIVDVPGHRDFIENMLAGVGGIDAVLFVVAADEGVMPQTREHLAILDILQIPGGVVALTKADLVDLEWIELVEDELSQVLSTTILKDAPCVRVSARTGQGLPELKDALQACLAKQPERSDLGRPRLPVDRVFTMPGFGTIATGTLSDGQFKVGEEVEILPQGLRGRIRGLQTHKQREDIAVPGSRTAINISGIDLDEIQRGCVIAHPGDYQPTRRLDVGFRLLPDVSQSLKHNTEVKLFIGTAEVIARLRLLGIDELLPGESGWLQLETSQPIVAGRGDRYILRRPSPGETLGGGEVIDSHPKGRHKRFALDTIDSLYALAQGSPADILLEALLAVGISPLKEVLTRSHLELASAGQAWVQLVDTHQVIDLDHDLQGEPAPAALPLEHIVAHPKQWQLLQQKSLHEIGQYHKNYPLRAGMPREELKSRIKAQLKNSPRIFNAVLRRLVMSGQVQEVGPLLRLPEHVITFNPKQQQAMQLLLKRFAQAPYAPPSIKECQADVGEEEFNAMVDLGTLLPVSSEVVFRKVDYDAMLIDIQRMFAEQGTLTAAQVRDHFNTSRRYILALLEYLDAIGVTARQGDARRLKNQP